MKQLRTWLVAKAAMILAAAPAVAGDMAAVQSIGFSDDGSVYAFEEYGIQDGSGFPYSNIHVIDTVKDAYLPGTPIRIRLDDENAGLSDARRAAMDKAQPLIGKYELGDNPGSLVAFNPVSEVGVEKYELRYLEYPADPAFGQAYTLKIEEFSVAPTGFCIDQVDALAAFRLRLTEKDGSPADELVYEDKSVPASRGCTVSYRLGGAVTYSPLGGAALHMALVNVLSRGFEGNDGRWIAVPVRP